MSLKNWSSISLYTRSNHFSARKARLGCLLQKRNNRVTGSIQFVGFPVPGRRIKRHNIFVWLARCGLVHFESPPFGRRLSNLPASTSWPRPRQGWVSIASVIWLKFALAEVKAERCRPSHPAINRRLCWGDARHAVAVINAPAAGPAAAVTAVAE